MINFLFNCHYFINVHLFTTGKLHNWSFSAALTGCLLLQRTICCCHCRQSAATTIYLLPLQGICCHCRVSTATAGYMLLLLQSFCCYCRLSAIVSDNQTQHYYKHHPMFNVIVLTGITWLTYIKENFQIKMQ